jgi:hypothetical protein
MSHNTHLLPRNPRLSNQGAALSRRGGLRVDAEGLCTEIASDTEQLGLLVDVFEVGVRLERPLTGASPLKVRERVVQLEFEHPGIDELIWCKGVIRFDKLEPERHAGGTRVRRVSGIEIVSAASRHLRMLRDFILDLRRAPEPEPAPFWSTAFRLG